MGLFTFGIILLVSVWIFSHLKSLARNYSAAKALGLPLIIHPFDPDSVTFALLSEPLHAILVRILPSSAYAYIQPCFFGWEFHNKGAIHQRLGPAFVLVTTGVNRLCCSDPTLASTFMTRRRDFVHADVSNHVMGIHGPNIISAGEDAWSRQRRIVAPALNERISSDVWDESIEQASSLADFLVSSSSSTPADDGASDTVPGLRSVAINVLSRIAYGSVKTFNVWNPTYDPKADLSYVDGIALCTDLLVAAAFIPAWILRLPVMPLSLQTLAAALRKLPDLAKNMLEQERERISSSPADEAATTTDTKKRRDTIMTTLLRLSDQAKEEAASGENKPTAEDGASSVGNKAYLTEPEIQGNLFVFTAAGFDTTANTMAYAVALLAAHPQWQPWIQAEIDSVVGSITCGQDGRLQVPEYGATFPKLIRCLAVMFETLRLYPAVSLLLRKTTVDQTITLPGPPSIQVPLKAPFTVQVNAMALHTDPEVWGSDALEFNPGRWVRPDPETPGGHVLMTPPKGYFVPWSIGPRTCPGQKMAQVEFVAVVMTLFGRCSAEPIPRDGESSELARRRVLDVTEDSQPGLTLQMKKPRDICLRWMRR
ncbi:hypothetical protein MCOR14_010290 [Pyricularia oryzae]|nr:hypothetical protein MCOR34_010592 [Pyricularia oryzae]KAI6441141.1 hypothetical protein MCOR22_006706 [Pyricularia oryzae]KAI6566140.1 hypothetical protein MCOR04_008830 [Pyricularia oryzae]KAI6620128.1 hypothetical protein MCOR14_010290 [Pyricularia oryzae]